MNRVWDLCKLLNNPKKVALMQIICNAGMDGVSVMSLANVMREDRLGKPAISQYLKQLAQLGVLQRRRNGKLVFYTYDSRRARPEVKEPMELIRQRVVDKGNMAFLRFFRTLMNPFRARVANYLDAGGNSDIGKICDWFGCSRQHFLVEMRLGMEDGVFRYDGDNVVMAELDDEIVRRIVRLVKS